MRSTGGLRSRSISRSTARCRSARRTRSPAGSRRRCARSSGRRSRSRPTSSRCSPTMSPGARRRPSGVRAVRDALTEIAAEACDLVGAIHDVRVREADGGEIVNFHCLVDPALERGRRAREGRRGGARAAAALSLDQARDRPRGAGAGLEVTAAAGRSRFRRRRHGISTAAPCRRPSRRSASASLAAASG